MKMIILSQNSDAIYDLEKFSSVFAKETSVYVMNYTGELVYCVGTYKTPERALDVVAEIFLMIGCQDKYEMPVV